MMTKKNPPPNYDYTAAKRNAFYRARIAARLDVALSAEDAAALDQIVHATAEPAAVIVRRLLREEAARLDR